MGVPKDISKSSWASKSLRSGFGKQCLSSQKSSPACGFGSSTRDASNRVRCSTCGSGVANVVKLTETALTNKDGTGYKKALL